MKTSSCEEMKCQNYVRTLCLMELMQVNKQNAKVPGYSVVMP